MNIAIVGAGRIGSAFAFHLARAGHDVTLVARGERLATLQQEQSLTRIDGTKVPVRAAGTLDPAVAYDLVMVTVMAHQVDALLPTLQASAAKHVMLVFNTFETIDRWRDAIGAARFSFSFPNMVAYFEQGRLRTVVDGPGMVTTMTSAEWAAAFKQAGLPTEVEPDMNAFLRSHVAFVVPTMVAAQWVWKRDHGLTWAESRTLVGALREALAVVRGLGHPLKPGFVAQMEKLPTALLTALLWAGARTAAVKDLGEFGPSEVRSLIDAMAAAAPGQTPQLLAIRPKD